MTLKEYQQKALKTWTVKENKMTYLRLGIRGECGEVCDKLKKLIRDCQWNPSTDPVPEDKRVGIALELGDVMWYAVVKAYENHRSITFTPDTDTKELNEIEPLNCNYIIVAAEDLYEQACEPFTAGVVFSVATIAKMLGYSLEEICQMNIDKLQSRASRGVISGSGDYR